MNPTWWAYDVHNLNPRAARGRSSTATPTAPTIYYGIHYSNTYPIGYSPPSYIGVHARRCRT